MGNEILVLSNKDQEGLLGRRESVDLVREVLTEYGLGKAKALPQRSVHVPKSEPDERYYWLQETGGAVPSEGVAAIRMDSSTVDVAVEKRGNWRREFPEPFAGFLLLFDIQENRPLALMADYWLNPIRVTAINTIVTDELARPDADTIGVFGRGAMATTQILQTCEVRDLDEVRVFSTHPEAREAFVEKMNDMTDTDVIGVGEQREAIEGCDIVAAATNSNEPVFDGELIESGTHVSTVQGGTEFLPTRELDEMTVERSDLIVANVKEGITRHKQPELYPLIRRGDLGPDDIYDAGDLLTDEIHGRVNGQQITLHYNNFALGLPYTVLAKRVYDKARDRDLGTTIDQDMFMQYGKELKEVRDNGFLFE